MDHSDTKIIILSGPSGAGKTSLVHALVNRLSMLTFSISATTRPMRVNEQDGVDYYFLSNEQFQTNIKNNNFVEWEEVYKDRFYGTLESEIKRIIADDLYPIFDIDVKGGRKLKSYYGAQALSIFIKPPTIEALELRLQKRGTNSPEEIKERLAKANEELKYADEFDQIIINDVVENAFKMLEKQVLLFISS